MIGLPANVSVQSARDSVDSDKYRLSWTVRSLSPLISYQLQLRVSSDSVRYGVSHVHLASFAK